MHTPGAETDSGSSVSGNERRPLSRDARMLGLLAAAAAVENGCAGALELLLLLCPCMDTCDNKVT